MFCIHAHLMGEVMDYYPDKTAGRTTSATRLGLELSKVLIALIVAVEGILVWFVFRDPWLAGFLAVAVLWLLLDLLVLFSDKEYTLEQYRLLGIFINLSAYGSITYLWYSGTLSGL
jgi:1,4-dihydroxy-2-naphthoate octaprenyltransferase